MEHTTFRETAVARGTHMGDGNYIRNNGGKIAGNDNQISSHGVSATETSTWRTRANNRPLEVKRK